MEKLYTPDNYDIRYGQNAIDSILVDYNAITHTPPMICNAGRIESGDPDFHLFGKDENTPAVVRLIERIDRERMAIGKALGLKQHTLEEEILMVKWNPNQEDYVLPLYDAITYALSRGMRGPVQAGNQTSDRGYSLRALLHIHRLEKC